MTSSKKIQRLIEAGSECYLPDHKYAGLIDMLTGNITDDQRREAMADAMKLELGERLNVWPASIEPLTDEEIAKSKAECDAHLAEIAADPTITVDPETGIPSNQLDETPEELEAALKEFHQGQLLSSVRDRLNGSAGLGDDVNYV
ncbi:hypothetical protein AAFN47_02005 [Hoeflea sp. CAU 1731]